MPELPPPPSRAQVIEALDHALAAFVETTLVIEGDHDTADTLRRLLAHARAPHYESKDYLAAYQQKSRLEALIDSMAGVPDPEKLMEAVRTAVRNVIGPDAEMYEGHDFYDQIENIAAALKGDG